MGRYQDFRVAASCGIDSIFRDRRSGPANQSEIVKTALDAGADILGIGIPFSDPVADGPTIQKADIRALKTGMTPRSVGVCCRGDRVQASKDRAAGLLQSCLSVRHRGVLSRDFKQAGEPVF